MTPEGVWCLDRAVMRAEKEVKYGGDELTGKFKKINLKIKLKLSTGAIDML